MQDKCQCDFRIRLLGDGCRYCQPQEYIDRLHDTMEDMVHVETLSDEEIIEIYNSIRSDKNMTWEEWCKEEIEFARAIEAKVRGEK